MQMHYLIFLAHLSQFLGPPQPTGRLAHVHAHLMHMFCKHIKYHSLLSIVIAVGIRNWLDVKWWHMH